MRFLSLILLSFLSVQPAFAEINSAKIKRAVDQLEKYVAFVAVHKVEGNTAEEQFKYLALTINESDEESFRIENYPDSIPGADEELGMYGLAKMSDAAGLVEVEIETNRGEAYQPEDMVKVKALLAKAKSAGALFGYTTDGGSVCGVTWPSPLVLDKKAKVIYELVLVKGPC